MRFVHTADIHLAAEPDKSFGWSGKRREEIWETFERLIAYTEREQMDFLFIAGDLFHRQPLLRELKEVSGLFSGLTKTRVILIAGNHDYIKQDSYYRNFQWSENVTFLKSEEVESHYFEDMNTEVYGASYYAKEDRCALYDGLHPEKKERINILLAHGGDALHRPCQVERLKESGFDYIAMGHIHKPSILLPDRIIQAGCPEPLEQNETGQRGFFTGEITKKESRVRFQAFQKRRYVPVEIEVTPQDTNLSLKKYLSEEIKREGEQNIFTVNIRGFRDEVIIFDRAQLMELGNICRLEDESQPDYDLDAMYKANAENVLGWYLKEFMEMEEWSDKERKALYYGIRALTLGE